MAAEDTQVGGDHYQKLDVQPWAAMEAWMTTEEFAGFLRGNVIKYVARCTQKNGLEDLRKARHYLDKLIEFEVQEGSSAPIRAPIGPPNTNLRGRD